MKEDVMRVERILVRKSDENYKAIKSACGKTRSLYNVANYLMRQSFFDKRIEKHSDIDKKLKREQHECYRSLPSSSRIQIISATLGHNGEVKVSC